MKKHPSKFATRIFERWQDRADRDMHRIVGFVRYLDWRHDKHDRMRGVTRRCRTRRRQIIPPYQQRQDERAIPF